MTLASDFSQYRSLRLYTEESKINVFFYAFMLALGLIIPLGPQNSFILSIGSHCKRYRQVIPVVLTAAICDTLLILLAVLGVSVAIMHLQWLKILLVVVGSLFLFYFGWISILQKPGKKQGGVLAPKSIKKQLLLITTFSIMNPFAWLDTVMVIGTNAATYTGHERITFTTTCILVSWLWFFFLAKVGQKVGQKLQYSPWKNRIIAIILWASAVLLLYRGFSG